MFTLRLHLDANRMGSDEISLFREEILMTQRGCYEYIWEANKDYRFTEGNVATRA